jgi:hypothetical protein
MEEQPYTLARWLVREGQEEAFIAAWHQLAAFFLMLKDAPRWETLLRNVNDTREFYSFGPWPSMETIAAMRAHPETPLAIGRLTALCEESDLGTYIVAATAGAAPAAD